MSSSPKGEMKKSGGAPPAPLFRGALRHGLLRGAPDGLRSGGHDHVFVAKCVGNGVDNGRRSRDRARFAAALDAERIGWTDRLDRLDLVRGQVVGARHAIVHEARRQELAVAVIVRAFEERLTDALGDAAVHLAFDDHRIDELAEVVDRGPTLDGYDAGLRIDLDLADVYARREGPVGRVPERAFLKAG